MVDKIQSYSFVSKLRKKKTKKKKKKKKKKKATCCKDWILRLFEFDLCFLLLTLFCFVLTSTWLTCGKLNGGSWKCQTIFHFNFQSLPHVIMIWMYHLSCSLSYSFFVNVFFFFFFSFSLFLGSRYNYNILKKCGCCCYYYYYY